VLCCLSLYFFLTLHQNISSFLRNGDRTNYKLYLICKSTQMDTIYLRFFSMPWSLITIIHVCRCFTTDSPSRGYPRRLFVLQRIRSAAVKSWREAILYWFGPSSLISSNSLYVQSAREPVCIVCIVLWSIYRGCAQHPFIVQGAPRILSIPSWIQFVVLNEVLDIISKYNPSSSCDSARSFASCQTLVGSRLHGDPPVPPSTSPRAFHGWTSEAGLL
jgi:hypothetical protein